MKLTTTDSQHATNVSTWRFSFVLKAHSVNAQIDVNIVKRMTNIGGVTALMSSITMPSNLKVLSLESASF